MVFIGNTTIQLVKFELNLINTTREEWNLKSKFHSAFGLVKFGFQIPLFTRGIYSVSFKFHSLYSGISNKILVLFQPKLSYFGWA